MNINVTANIANHLVLEECIDTWVRYLDRIINTNKGKLTPQPGGIGLAIFITFQEFYSPLHSIRVKNSQHINCTIWCCLATRRYVKKVLYEQESLKRENVQLHELRSMIGKFLVTGGDHEGRIFDRYIAMLICVENIREVYFRD